MDISFMSGAIVFLWLWLEIFSVLGFMLLLGLVVYHFLKMFADIIRI